MSNSLWILGATYGQDNVTGTLQNGVRDGSLRTVANNGTFGDGWPGHRKFLVVAYMYEGELAHLAVASEGDRFVIESMNKPGNQEPEEAPWVKLRIIAAAYGPKDVTQQVRGLVHDHKLVCTANNDTFGPDPAYGIEKTLTVVYRIGAGSEPRVKLVTEGARLEIHESE